MVQLLENQGSEDARLSHQKLEKESNCALPVWDTGMGGDAFSQRFCHNKFGRKECNDENEGPFRSNGCFGTPGMLRSWAELESTLGQWLHDETSRKAPKEVTVTG